MFCRNILVTGGAGYIGSHTVIKLIEEGYNPIIVDNLSTGHRKAVHSNTFYKCDLSEIKKLKEIMIQHEIDTVMHFATSCYVGESVVNPHKYFKNNVTNTINLLEAMLEAEVKNFIFSSTASIYGQPVYTPLDEKHPKEPCNPYGTSNLFIEKIVETYEKAYGIRHIYLRYFNAAGSDYLRGVGEDHYPETHIIPLLIQVALGMKKEFRVFGQDYDTPDGTCIRDYIHVMDLADAHINAIKYLEKKGKSRAFNLGSGKGYSVKEIIKKVQQISGSTIKVKYSERRKGDPSILIASYEAAKKMLDWSPKRSLSEIISSSWEWSKRYPKGYNDVK